MEKGVQLSRREREIMEALYSLGQGTAAEVRDALADPPSYTTVRTLLGILKQKGHVSYFADGPRYVYQPLVPRQEMAKRSLNSLIRTFFGGSVERAVMTLLTESDTQISEAELDRLAASIEEARNFIRSGNDSAQMDFSISRSAT